MSVNEWEKQNHVKYKINIILPVEISAYISEKKQIHVTERNIPQLNDYFNLKRYWYIYLYIYKTKIRTFIATRIGFR